MTAVADWNSLDVRREQPLARRIATALTRSRGRAALREAGARPLSPESSARLMNVVTGVADALSIPVPRVFVFSGDANALVVRSGRDTIAIATSYLQSLTRTELEAVVSHCLVRLTPSSHRGDPVGYDDDVRAAATTRFPPALASALTKARPYRGRFAPLYLVAEHPSHRPVAERVAALNDL
jgi:hypothetical protein